MSQLKKSEKSLDKTSAICFLVINYIKELPTVAILSALQSTTSDIYVGYIDSANIEEIPKDHRVKFIKLNSKGPNDNKENMNYRDFGTTEFYELVILKWKLLREVSSIGYGYVVYSDIDVVWIGDAAKRIEDTFQLFTKAHVLVQSFTRNPNDALLCMGIFAFRNGSVSAKFIELCEFEHKLALARKERIGDDEIVTAVNKKLGFPEYLKELPQSTFAVGNFLDLYSSRARYPGMHKPIPLIFHCNYVVGLRNKRLLLRLFLSRKQRKSLNIKFGIGFYVLLVLKRSRLSALLRLLRAPI